MRAMVFVVSLELEGYEESKSQIARSRKVNKQPVSRARRSTSLKDFDTYIAEVRTAATLEKDTQNSNIVVVVPPEAPGQKNRPK